MSDKYIFRRTQEDKFTIIPNALIRDTRLSWEARGLLMYLLSQKPDWTVRKTDLERQSQANDFVVSRILKELEDTRYIYREQVNDEDSGRFEWVTYVFDSPIPQSSTDGKPPHIISTDKERTTTEKATKQDVLDAMIAYSGNGDNLADYPADVVPYLEAFVEKFKRDPSKQEKATWIKGAREWMAMGVRPEDVGRMYDYCRKLGLPIKSPYSIMFAYDAMRQEQEKLPTNIPVKEY